MAVLDAQRRHCVELNYFTAKQLLYLRKEVADLKRGRDFGSLEVQIYTLLDSVLPGVNANLLQQALIAIDIDVDDPMMTDNQSLRMEVDDDLSEQSLRERHKKLFKNIEDLGFDEEVALAAIVACNSSDESDDLLMWCIKNNGREDVIDEMCGEGARNPKYTSLFPQVQVEEVRAGVNEMEDMKIEESDMETDEHHYISKLDQTLEGRYLSLQELSTLLRSLAHTVQGDKREMKFPEYLKRGDPNLLIVPQGDILATVIGLYLESDVFPSRHEVLVCTQDTTLEEVELLWRRCLANEGDKFYCLVNAENLSLGDSKQAIESFEKLTKEYNNGNLYNSTDYQLVVICSSEQETRSHMATALDKYQVKGTPRCPRPYEVLLHLKNLFKAPPTKTVHFGNHEIDWIPAAEVENRQGNDSRLSVLVISSQRSGTGKTLVVEDFVEQLDELRNNQEMTDLLGGEPVAKYIIVPLLGKTVNLSDTVGFLLPYSLKSDVPVSRIFHFDVSPSVEFGLDTLLFNLLYLGSIQDRRGRVWIRNPRDLYAIEMISSENQQQMLKAKNSIHEHFYNELPAIQCVAPNEVLEKVIKNADTEESVPLFNQGKLQSVAVQRVFQYLRILHDQPEFLHEFEFDPEQLNLDDEACLRLLTSFPECFMILRSQARIFQPDRWATTLLLKRRSEVKQKKCKTLFNFNFEGDGKAGLNMHSLFMTPHPYLFFNPDHATFTFLGFRIDPDGNLIDPSSGDIIREGLMTRHLRTGLHVQLVNFEENFESLEKMEKITKICRVLGVEWPHDPDETYELTEDNAKKILAIHMRFRCGIPVVVMGETGCGKTKLIRYLCGLQSGFGGPKNMLLVKVHGGTSFRDIEKKVQQAKKMAKQNIKNNVETIVFFDEVNTTEALDLVKEIMVDRRLNGRPLGQEAEGLRFIAACNPYRKHTDTMIKKLESAGLGYSVKTEDINDRIGRVPLRHLVYRVHALPESMCSLIWDFGQLKPEVEVLYARQIVRRHVSTTNLLVFSVMVTQKGLEGNGIPGDESLVEAITSVLSESQRYMREQRDECSFVSLRDVERTMIVMIWFYEHRDVFQPLLEVIAGEESHKEEEPSDSEDSDDSSSDEMRTSATKKRKKDLPSYFQRERSSRVHGISPEDQPVASTSGLRPQDLDFHEDGTNEEETFRRHMRPLPSVVSREPPFSWPWGELSKGPVTTDLLPPEIYNDAYDVHAVADADADEVHADANDVHADADEVHADADEVHAYDADDYDDHDDDDDDDITKCIDPITWSLILAIGVCYHAKLQDREQYRRAVARAFKRPCALYGGADRILQEISRCQQAVLKDLDIGPNIARNTALSENVFMMVVCIELRIPLFVIGKPGSSKSLAKTVVDSNMQGVASKSDLFKKFKEVQMSAHQCSPLSTPEGIQETFRQCANLQKDKNPDKFVSVVVLDEVGLAEDSPLLPLKTLHPLLEDGVTSDDIIETDEKPIRVAFIGISNWALDPAKMNRGIMLSRDVPGLKELQDSAMGICASDEDVQERVAPIIPALAKAYSQLYDDQKELHVLKESKKDEFFGLRDFYSLIKMIFGVAKDKKRIPNWKDVEYAVRRNFGGLDVNDLDPVEIFMKHLHGTLLDVPLHLRKVNNESENKTEFSPLNLIKSNLVKDPSETHTSSRYLLILTENYAALRIVQQYLNDTKIKEDENAHVLIFGSSFPKDLEYTQVCRNINNMKVCMETGRTVILLNMERLYEGLYDALNQYYVEFGGNKYVDLGLGTHRVKCRVHPKFRLIVIAEKSTVYNEFPIPLINRLEKHFLVLSTSLTPPQEQLVKILTDWVKRFSQINTPQYKRKGSFSEGDAFVGYHEDTIPSVVLQVCSSLGKDGTTLNHETKDEWEETVLSESKRLLVQCCTPDAIVRLHSSGLTDEADEIWDLYFNQQRHSSLAAFLTSVDRTKQHKEGLLIQVSTHSRLLSECNLDEISEALHLHHQYVSCITLQQFQTEQQFCDCVGDFFAHLGGEEGLLIVQCIPGDMTFNLLACARHLLLKQRAEITELHLDNKPIHIIVIIQLPRVLGGYPDFVGFQGQRWESVHIDELFTPSLYVPSLESIKDQSLSDLFEASIDMCFKDGQEQVLDAVDVLRQCVQAAARRINDDQYTVARATKRIVILLELLGKEMNETHAHDINSFPHALIRRVHELLKERDDNWTKESGTKWSTSEALELSDLQESGTYRKALWRKIQNAIVPILSELIAFIDKDGNLELLQRTNPAWLTDLWLQIFQDNQLTQLHYESFMTGDVVIRSHVPVTSSGRDSHMFHCRLPFSWLLKEKVDSMWTNAKSVAENSNKSVEECLRRMIVNSDVSVTMDTINKSQEGVERYIQDFVHMNYKPVEQDEVELVARAIIVTTRQLHASSARNDTDFTFPDIASVHKAFARIELRLACFAQLVRCQPRIVPRLLDAFSVDESEMTLDAIALQICLESLEPQEIDMESAQERGEWCELVISVRAPAERMMGNSHENNLDNEEKTMCILNRCRPLWERITAIRIFIEHVYPPGKRLQLDTKNISKLCRALDEWTDFSSATSIEAVQLFLVECMGSFSSSSTKDANEFRHRCNSFFMELIALLCFGGKDHKTKLDPEVFDIFMRYITGSGSSETKCFSPFPDFKVDKTPVVRSFLLQQLLTISDEDVKKYIQRYLAEAQALSSDLNHVTRVCQLTVDCIEDSLAAQFSDGRLSLDVLIGVSTKLISDAGKVLRDVDTSDKLDINVVEAISNTRHVLTLTAEWLFKRYVTDDVSLREEDVLSALHKLLMVVEAMFSQLRDCAPVLYLLKQLARRYGGSVIRELTREQEMHWLIPLDLDSSQIDAVDPDRFIVYGDVYMHTRDALAQGLLSGNVDDLMSMTQGHAAGVSRDVMCLLSIYREITCGYRQPKQKLTEQKELRVFLAQPDNLSTQAQQLAAKLLDNSHGEGFSALSAQPAQPEATINLAEVVVHTMIVLQCSGDNEVMSTLKSLMDKPATMKDSFLPTMPEDEFEKVRTGLIEPVTWYECPEGHRYSIGDCGRANQESQCPECKSGIGGTGYQLLPGNKPLMNATENRSSRGHILGNANPNTSSSDTGRNLPPAVVHIVRLIMHSAMLVGSCRHPEETVTQFTPPVEQGRLSEFIWAHMTRDLRCLATSLNRSEDEALLTVHSVLGRITEVCAESISFHPHNGVLSSSSDRRQWEIEFNSSFIEPVLSTLDERIQTCFVIMSEDKRVGTDPLMRQIYEIDSTEHLDQLGPMNPCFWRYRARITLEHAKQMFSEKMKADKKHRCKVLLQFFREEHKLRAVRFIPDIHKLQRILMDHCNRRLDKKKALEMTVKAFQMTLNGIEAQREFKSLFASFKSAWRVVCDSLDKQGRFKLSSETCSMTMGDDTTLTLLLPITNGQESCSMAVLFYLINAHNDFLQSYLNIANSNSSNASKIPIAEVTRSQMVSYDADRDLLPLIRAHCQYSLAIGQGTLVEYDWAAIQRHVIDRLIRGKSLVIFKVRIAYVIGKLLVLNKKFYFQETQFMFLRHNEDIFFSVRAKIKQENISASSVKMINSELRRLNDVCEVKDSLELAIGFLGSSGGKPDQLISEYLHDILCIPQERGLRSRRSSFLIQPNRRKSKDVTIH
ncbi:hypothetical protein QZH41_016501 [Actinostola sp. cb2023]|nr:hypothetical protein QZH41_016501 [Actinostola sp. cb2023]